MAIEFLVQLMPPQSTRKYARMSCPIARTIADGVAAERRTDEESSGGARRGRAGAIYAFYAACVPICSSLLWPGL